MKKVIIVSRQFPPMNTMAAKRYGYMCKYMNEYGWEPYVIASYARNGGYLKAKQDLEIPVGDDQIQRIGMMGMIYPVDNLLFKFLLDYANSEGSLRVFESASWGWFERVKKNLATIDNKGIKLVLGTYPSIENLLVARYISQMYGIPYVVDIRDLMSDYKEGISQSIKAQFFESITERAIIKPSKGVICVTTGFQKIISRRYPKKPVEVIYNGWDDKVDLLDNRDDNLDGDYIYYAGSLYEHRLKSFERVLFAFSLTNAISRMIIRSLGPRDLEIKLRNLIISLGLETRVSILPAVGEDIIRKEQRHAAINLIPSTINREDKALMSTLPGKLFELLRIDRPILAIIPADTELSCILKKTNKGIGTTNVDEMLNFFEDRHKCYTGNESIMQYSRRHQTKNLCLFMDSMTT